jgi:hypothetical protein
MYTNKTLTDALAVLALSDWLDDAHSAEVWAAEAQDEYNAEHAAEYAWLRAAESAGWEEAYTESLYESGLIARPW